MDALIGIPGDRTAARAAYAAAGLGAVGAATLGAMFAVEVPRNGPYVFGTINDATGALFNLAAVPVILQVHRRLPRTRASEAAMTVQAGWFLLAHRALLASGACPRNLGRLGQAIGGTLLVALPVAGLTWAEQLPRWIRYGIGGAGVAAGAAAWVAWPYWYFLAGQHLSHPLKSER